MFSIESVTNQLYRNILHCQAAHHSPSLRDPRCSRLSSSRVLTTTSPQFTGRKEKEIGKRKNKERKKRDSQRGIIDVLLLLLLPTCLQLCGLCPEKKKRKENSYGAAVPLLSHSRNEFTLKTEKRRQHFHR